MPRPWWISCTRLGTSSETSLISPSSPALCPSSWARSTGTSSLPVSAGMPQVLSQAGPPHAHLASPQSLLFWWLEHQQPALVPNRAPLSFVLFFSCPHRPGCGRGPIQPHSSGTPETPQQVRHGGPRDEGLKRLKRWLVGTDTAFWGHPEALGSCSCCYQGTPLGCPGGV